MRREPIYQPRQQVQPSLWQRPHEPVHRPLPVIQPQQVQQQEQPKRQHVRPRVRMRFPGWLFQFIIASTLLTIIWWTLAGSVGSIFPDPAWDFWVWLGGIVFFFFAYMTGWANRWAEENCVFFKKGGD